MSATTATPNQSSSYHHSPDKLEQQGSFTSAVALCASVIIDCYQQRLLQLYIPPETPHQSPAPRRYLTRTVGYLQLVCEPRLCCTITTTAVITPQEPTTNLPPRCCTLSQVRPRSRPAFISFYRRSTTGLSWCRGKPGRLE